MKAASEKIYRTEPSVRVRVADASFKGRKVILGVAIKRASAWVHNETFLTRKRARAIGEELIAAAERRGRIAWSGE